MNVITCRHYEELSEKAASIIAETVKQKPDAVLGLATGALLKAYTKNLCGCTAQRACHSEMSRRSTLTNTPGFLPRTKTAIIII